jgi:hypothetical protein
MLEQRTRTPEQAKALLDRISSNKKFHTDKTSGVLSSMSDKYDKMPQLPKDHEWYYHGPESVPLSSIKTNQHGIYGRDRLHKIIDRISKDETDHRATGYMHPDGTTYLHDGNHTIASHRLVGKKNILLGVFKARKKNE